MLNFKPLTICLDFDGTIVESDYPEINVLTACCRNY